MSAVFEFGEFVLDCERFELRRGPHRVRLERKPLDLLILLASSGGRLVTRDEIARCLWPSEVYVDTEHGINTAIRKIRRALRENPDQPRFLLTVIGKGYRFTGATLQPAPELPAVPNPIQLSSPIDPARQPTLSEARYPEPTPSAALHPEQSGPTPGVEPPLQFAETAYTPVEPGAPAQPERSGTGLDSETSVSPSPASSSQAHKLWVTVSAAALVAAIAIGFGVRTTHAHAVKTSITSIAVLPLDNVSGDPTQNYLADGMTDELITQLAKDSSLRVISRTSVMQFKGAHRPLPEIARQLNVDGILEGSIGRSGNNLHMTVQLIHGPSDTHLWAESYDRYASDTVSLPQEAALSIARQTHSAIVSATPPQKYVNPAAHDAYLRGNFHWFSGDQAGAAPYYKQATEIQPDYAAAWSGLADSYSAGAVDLVFDPRQALPLGVSAARRSLDLDPSLARAHLSFGAARYWLTDWNIPAALREFDEAIQLDPTISQAWHMRGKLFMEEGRYEQGVEQERKAMEIDPFQRPWAMVYAYTMSHNYEAAIAEAEQQLRPHPDPVTWLIVRVAYDSKRMDKESEHALEEYLTLTNQKAKAEVLHAVFARGGRNAVLQWRLDDLKDQSRTHYASPYLFAYFYAELGDKQHALDYLDECVRQHSPQLLDLQMESAFDSFHSDPHYRAIVQKVGLPPT